MQDLKKKSVCFVHLDFTSETMDSVDKLTPYARHLTRETETAYLASSGLP